MASKQDIDPVIDESKPLNQQDLVKFTENNLILNAQSHKSMYIPLLHPDIIKSSKRENKGNLISLEKIDKQSTEIIVNNLKIGFSKIFKEINEKSTVKEEYLIALDNIHDIIEGNIKYARRIIQGKSANKLLRSIYFAFLEHLVESKSLSFFIEKLNNLKQITWLEMLTTKTVDHIDYIITILKEIQEEYIINNSSKGRLVFFLHATLNSYFDYSMILLMQELFLKYYNICKDLIPSRLNIDKSIIKEYFNHFCNSLRASPKNCAADLDSEPYEMQKIFLFLLKEFLDINFKIYISLKSDSNHNLSFFI